MSTSLPYHYQRGRLFEGAGMHGIVMLHQSGMLSHGPDYQALAYFLGLTMLKGAGARMATAPAKRTAGRQKK